MISRFIAPSVAISVVLVLAWWCGRLAQRIGQPAVVGELTAGVIVVGLMRGETIVTEMLVLCAAYLAVMLVLVRPALERLRSVGTTGRRRVTWLSVVAVVALLSTFVADRIGIHAVFGAFFAGACMPRGQGALDSVEKPLRHMSSILLPAFFVLTGLRTQVTLMTGAAHWLITLSVIACASAGKLGGSAFAARTLGFSWRESLAIGALLNTRGLVALVALDVGRDLGILSPTLFTVFVVMVFVTTLATVPLLRVLGFRPLTNAPARP